MSSSAKVTHRIGEMKVEIDVASARLRVELHGSMLLDVPLSVSVAPVGATDQDRGLTVVEDRALDSQCRRVSLETESSQFARKQYRVDFGSDWFKLSVVGHARDAVAVDQVTFFPGADSSTSADRFYAPRFDWAEGAVIRPLGSNDTLACQQWLSPPPFCYCLHTAIGWTPVGIAAAPGQNNFQSFDLKSDSGVQFGLTYEGHWVVDGEFETPALLVHASPSTDPNVALASYVNDLEALMLLPKRPVDDGPAWWREPIFCGWGEQRLQYRRRHDNGESGWWVNAGDLATESLYRKSLAALEAHGINPGTVVVDCFWSRRGCFCEPDSLLWTDLKGFIAEQHAKGRKVLLWLTPILFDGLPLDACMQISSEAIAADPTSTVYRAILAREIEKMISPSGLDADGFKIDFTQNIPAEEQIFRNILKDKWAIISDLPEKCYPRASERDSRIVLAQPLWGVEIVRAYLEAIRAPMKATKPDALLITHTPNPYLRDLPDMIRLNDLDGTLSRDVPSIMRNRASITRACGGQHWLIDTDNDLMIDKEMWRAYIVDQPNIGVPDTYYATGIATSGERFDTLDYQLLRETWATYRKALK